MKLNRGFSKFRKQGTARGAPLQHTQRFNKVHAGPKLVIPVKLDSLQVIQLILHHIIPNPITVVCTSVVLIILLALWFVIMVFSYINNNLVSSLNEQIKKMTHRGKEVY